MHVLFVASEAVPFAKTGGLADVAGELPRALVQLDFQVDIVIPFYASIQKKYGDRVQFLKEFDVFLGSVKHTVAIYSTLYEKSRYYFVRHDGFFAREQLYGYGDDGERFALFTHGVLEMIAHLQLHPEILHCHDWHAAMVPVLYKEHYAKVDYYRNIRTLLTIHNPAFQGSFAPEKITEWYGLPYNLFENGQVRFQQHFNYLKAGIMYADKINTVSPTNARELLTEEGSNGLHSVLKFRQDDFLGILNGIDYDRYNPSLDSFLPNPYSADNLEGKKINKSKFQKDQGLLVDESIPLFAMVTRLSWQKGINLVIQAIDRMVLMGAQLFIVGTGESWYEDEIRKAVKRYPGQVGAFIGYNEALAHQLYAASDFYLMPSLFEPCGLSQMIALRYGSVPIVRSVGGLYDSVEAYNEYTPRGNGFRFNNFDSEDMIRLIGYALHFYHLPDRFKGIIQQAMITDFSWKNSAQKYLELYQKILLEK